MTRRIDTKVIPAEQAAVTEATGELFINGGETGAFVVDVPNGMYEVSAVEVEREVGQMVATAMLELQGGKYDYVHEGEKKFVETSEHSDGFNLTDFYIQANVLSVPALRLSARGVLRVYQLDNDHRKHLREWADRQFDGPVSHLEAIPRPILSPIFKTADLIRLQTAHQHLQQTIVFVNGYPGDARVLPDVLQTHEFITLNEAGEPDRSLARFVSFGRVSLAEPQGTVFD